MREERGARAAGDGPLSICGPRVIAASSRAIDNAAIRALGPVASTIEGFDAALSRFGRITKDHGDLRGRHRRKTRLARSLPDRSWADFAARFQARRRSREGWCRDRRDDALACSRVACRLDVECLDARRVKSALQMRLNKTDHNDAEGLAQVVRTGWYRSVHVKSLDAHQARSLLGARAQLVGMRTRLSNMVRGVLKTFGLLPGADRAASGSTGALRR